MIDRVIVLGAEAWGQFAITAYLYKSYVLETTACLGRAWQPPFQPISQDKKQIGLPCIHVISLTKLQLLAISFH